MDPLTHTLVGVGMAEAFFKRRFGRETVPILAWASNLPDIDTAVLLTGDPAAVTLRRTFGHSVFLLPFWSLLLALLFKRIYPRHPLRRLFGLCLLGAGVHVFFDLVNSFGVVLLWPFTLWRPELAIIFIIDLILLAFLAAPLLSKLPFAGRVSPQAAHRLSMACVAGYIMFCLASRFRAQELLKAEASRLKPEFSYVFPEPLGPHRWRGVLRRDNLYRVYLVHSLSGSVEFKDQVATELDDPAVQAARKTPLARRLEAFFKAPVWEREDGAVGVYDLRFRPLVIKRGRAFRFDFKPSA